MKIRALAIARIFAALAIGMIFGTGLAISGMIDPTRVRGFLDITGNFDPSLGLVFAGALIVSTIGYHLSRRIQRPLLDSTFHVPQGRAIDLRLVAGSVIFGVGWGMAGLCPGPAIASLSMFLAPTFLFTATMVLGIIAYDHWAQPKATDRIKSPVDAQV
jgi:uncharacterized membrane protein YedE/YeeE